MQSNINLFQLFLEEEDYRSKIELSGQLEIILDHLEYLIRVDFDKNDKNTYKSKRRKKEISDDLKNALCSCSREEKVNFYLRAVEHVRRFQKGRFSPPKAKFSGLLSGKGFSRSFNLKMWKEKLLRLDRERHTLLAEKEKKIKSYDLGNYLLRASKNKSYNSFVLEAINSKPHDKSRTVHIGFDSSQQYEEWFDSIKASVEFKEWEFIKELFRAKKSSSINNSFANMASTDRGYYAETMREVEIGKENGHSTSHRGSGGKKKSLEAFERSVVVRPNKRSGVEE